MIIKKLHDMGIRSEHAYTAALASIGLTVAVWAGSLTMEPGTGLARADRWGLFVGEWAPTFFGLGLALSHYEQHDGTLTSTGADVRDLRATTG
ncbi:hypothetical protein ACF05T_06800 [Streptomyces lateritius]|uniref:Uncharacterized protein n=1 Tax=Streptomyces lateritius TaxID=67313 RepID=A0ABW6Y7M3_9ACTN